MSWRRSAGRRRLAPQAERHVEEDVVEQPRDDERGGDPDRQRAVVPVEPGVDRSRRRSAESRATPPRMASASSTGPPAAGRTAERVPPAGAPGLIGAKSALATPRDRPESWKSRIPATPAMRSRQGSSRSRSSSRMPPMAKTWLRARSAAGAFREPPRRATARTRLSKACQRPDRSAPGRPRPRSPGAPPPGNASRRRSETPGRAGRTRESGKPEAGRWTPSAPAASAISNRRFTKSGASGRECPPRDLRPPEVLAVRRLLLAQLDGNLRRPESAASVASTRASPADVRSVT